MKKNSIESLSASIKKLEDLKTEMIDEINDSNESIKEDFVYLSECSAFDYNSKDIIKIAYYQYRLMKNRRRMVKLCCWTDKRIEKWNHWIQKLEG